MHTQYPILTGPDCEKLIVNLESCLAVLSAKRQLFTPAELRLRTTLAILCQSVKDRAAEIKADEAGAGVGQQSVD